MVRWMCGVKLNERKKSEELTELLGLEPVSLKKSTWRWFGHVERKDDNNWVKRCITWEVEAIRQTGVQDARKRPGRTVLRMTWKVQHSSGINGEGGLRGQPTNPGSPGKMAVKTECVYWLTEVFPPHTL